jgi:hypothetical protein
MSKRDSVTRIPPSLTALLLPLIGILPMLNGSFGIQTADGPFHVHRIFAMTTLMQTGDLYPRWIPWFHLGYGYPVLNFYAPLGTWLGGVLGVLGIPAALAFALLTALGWMFGSLGTYYLARHYLGISGGLLAAALWSYAPSLLQGVWNIGSLPQHLAAALLPWVCLSLLRLIEQPTLQRIGGVGLVLGLLLLTHQPTTVLAGLVIGPGSLLLCGWFARRGQTTFRRSLGAVLMAGLLGVGVAGIFLMPLLLEVGWIQVSRGADDIPTVIAASFVPIQNLFLPPTAPDLSDLQRVLPDTIGLVTGVLMLGGLIGLLLRRQYRLALAWGVAAGVIGFLILEVSLPVWLSVPLLDQLRFPARALRLGTVFFSLLGAAIILLLPERGRVWAAGIITGVMLAGLPTIYPSQPWVDYTALSAADFIQYEHDTNSFGGTSYDEFKPIWGERIPYDVPADLSAYRTHPLRIYVVQPDAADATVTQLTDRAFQVQVFCPFEVRFQQFYFPGWVVTVDGVEADIYPEPDRGLIALQLPAGEHRIEVRYAGTPVQWIAPWITLLSLAVVLWLIRQPVTASFRQVAITTVDRRLGWAVGCAVVGFALVNTLFIQPQTDWFRQQSPLDAPVAMQIPLHVRFGDAYELLGYTLSQDNVEPGGLLRLTLFWRALRPLEEIYAPTVQLVDPGVTEAWGASSDFFVGQRQQWHTPDYFVSDRFVIPIFADAPPYVGRLRVQLRDTLADAWLRTDDGADQVLLPTPVRIMGRGPQVTRPAELLQVGEALRLICVQTESGLDGLDVALYWLVRTPLADEIRLFVHGLDAQGEMVAAYNGPPLNGLYAPSLWLSGQTLVERVRLTPADAVESVGLGFFEAASGVRLPLQSGGQPVPDDRYILALGGAGCTG